MFTTNGCMPACPLWPHYNPSSQRHVSSVWHLWYSKCLNVKGQCWLSPLYAPSCLFTSAPPASLRGPLLSLQTIATSLMSHMFTLNWLFHICHSQSSLEISTQTTLLAPLQVSAGSVAKHNVIKEFYLFLVADNAEDLCLNAKLSSCIIHFPSPDPADPWW